MWPTVVPWLEAALAAEPDSHDTLLDVFQKLSMDPCYQLWIADTGCYVTRVWDAPHRSVLHVWLAGGNMVAMKALHPLAVAFGRELGCEAMTLIGRRGWERSFLRHEGWHPTAVHLEKRLA